MSHRHTVIEPADGLTVLVGPNNCGKSAFVTALQILCHNSASGFVLRHGEKKCEVIVETQDGHVIHWSRKKNGAGTYIVDGKPFDRLRGKVPEAVHQILKMPKVVCDKDEFDVHFGEQTDPVFLLKDRGKAAAQFFASSSDATHLVAMQHEHKSNVTVAKRDFKRLNDQQQLIQKQLKELAPIDDLDSRLSAIEKQHEKILDTTYRLQQLQTLSNSIRMARGRMDNAKQLASALQPLHKPPIIGDEKSLETLVERFSLAVQQLTVSTSQSNNLKNLIGPPELDDTNSLAHVVSNIKDANVRCRRSERLASQLDTVTAPPEIIPESDLETLLKQLRLKNRQLDSARAAADALTDLTIATPQLPVEPLQQMIAQIKSCQHTTTFAQQNLDTVAIAGQPPVPLETNSISVLIAELTDKHEEVKIRETSIADAEKRLQVARDEITKWADANPTCPTCGGQTKSNKLIDHACQTTASGNGDRRG